MRLSDVVHHLSYGDLRKGSNTVLIHFDKIVGDKIVGNQITKQSLMKPNRRICMLKPI